LSTSDAPLHQLALSTELSHDVDNNDDGSSLHLLSLNKLAHTWRMKIHRTFSQCPMDDGMQSLMAKCYKWTQILDQTLNNRENTIFNVSSLAQQFNKVSTQLFQVHSALINNQQGQKYKAKADQIKLMELANVVIELYQATRHLTIVANDEASKAQQLNVSDHKLTLSEMFATTQHHYVTPNQDQIDGETNFHHLLLPEFSI
jgi:hypothetical protein